MKKQKLINIIADTLELDHDQVRGDGILSEYNSWDSLLLIRLIPLLEEEIGRKIQIYEVMNAKTIDDILNLE
jgi:acyl carrier protein